MMKDSLVPSKSTGKMLIMTTLQYEKNKKFDRIFHILARKAISKARES